MIPITLFASVACLTYVLYVVIDFYWRFYKLSDIPGPFCVPLISHAKRCLFKDLTGLLEVFREFKDAYGEFFKSWFGPELFFVVSKAEYLKVILNHQNCLEKATAYKYIHQTLGNGLVTSPVDVWRVHRKMINPTFNQTLFTSRLSVVNKNAENLIGVLKQNYEQDNILDDVTNCFLDITSEIMFQFKLDALKNNERLGSRLKFLSGIVVSRMLKIWLQPDYLFKLTKQYKEYLKSKKELDDFALHIFSNKLSSIQDEVLEDDDNNRYFFAHLLKFYRNNELSKEDFLDQIKVLAAAGAETTASSLCFSLIFLGMFKEVQSKVYEEIVENVGNREITLEDLPNLKYTECVIKEILRLTPVVLFIARKTTGTVDLGKYTIPKDSQIFVSILDLHRDEKYWPDPLKFDPDRFRPENSSKIYPYSYLPFLAGPRNCIGQKQGMVMMKIVLAQLVRYFKIGTYYKSVEEIEFLPHIVTEAKDGFKINLEKRC